MYEQARVKIAKFINAPSAHQIIYTRNTTESINLVAYTWARANLKSGDLIILTEMEHHSNLSRGTCLRRSVALRLEFIPVTDDGLLDLDVYRSLLSQDPKLVSFTHMSNVLGTINPAAEIIRIGSRSWRSDCSRRGSIRSAPESGCAKTGCGFHGFFCTQDVRANRDRRVIRKDCLARSDASIPRRRRHDQGSEVAFLPTDHDPFQI